MTSAKLNRIVKTITIFATLLLFSLLTVIAFQYIELGRQKAEATSLQAKMDSLMRETEDLEEGIDYRLSPHYLESYAREQLGMIKEGEKLYIIKK